MGMQSAAFGGLNRNCLSQKIFILSYYKLDVLILVQVFSRFVCAHFGRWYSGIAEIPAGFVELPLNISDPDGKVSAKMHPTAWPWDALNWLYRTDKLFSWASNDTDRVHEECDAYWRKLAKESMDVKGPDARMTFPLNWHADGVRVYKQQKCWVYSYSCALKKGPSLSSKLMLLLVREPLLRKPDTHDAIGKVIGWIQRVLQTGLFPPTDFMGSAWPPDSLEAARANLPFAGGYKCAFSAFKGDWEARAVIHKLQRSYNHNNICEHCPASKLDNGFNYRDFSLNAPYLDVQFKCYPTLRDAFFGGLELGLETRFHRTHGTFGGCRGSP